MSLKISNPLFSSHQQINVLLGFINNSLIHFHSFSWPWLRLVDNLQFTWIQLLLSMFRLHSADNYSDMQFYCKYVQFLNLLLITMRFCGYGYVHMMDFSVRKICSGFGRKSMVEIQGRPLIFAKDFQFYMLGIQTWINLMQL